MMSERDHWASQNIGGALPTQNPEALAFIIRQGKTNRRNPTLSEHTFRMLPYRGMGSGIPRALEEWPQIELISEASGNQFTALVRRPAAQWLEATPQVMQLLLAMAGEHSRQELQARLGLADREQFARHTCACIGCCVHRTSSTRQTQQPAADVSTHRGWSTAAAEREQ